ncbi:MAG TPA: hypothetical protein PK307_09495 [Spirochaetota bacterium]|nr:hypothetical protein [Spirochaetota bacterium]HOD14158.1 hypothetical protein [Spirochaetota bacterium]HPG49203.1 hypothetical protein [Spirochaetota bacterium]HPN10745.1 hypothetical protein [Spirochaetota bacterium]HQL82423.1 hypothetical protein [Spirochaetota bacterium]
MKQKKHSGIIRFFALAIVSLLAVSCLTMGDARQWLLLQKGEKGVNITGNWDSGPFFSGGWGSGHIVQTGMEIIGTMGLYSIEGVVNGDTISLIFISGNRIYYTGQVKLMPDGTLVGTAVEKAIINTADGQDSQKYPVILTRYKKTR